MKEYIDFIYDLPENTKEEIYKKINAINVLDVYIEQEKSLI